MSEESADLDKMILNKQQEDDMLEAGQEAYYDKHKYDKE